MELEFDGEVIEWRGPAPFYYLVVPDDESDDISAVKQEFTYGWGVIPVTCHVDDLPVWSIWCIRVRPRHRGRGISHVLLDGAVAYAARCGAPAVEGYPVDNEGAKVDLTMAYVGTRKLFEDAGFVLASTTDAVAGGFPRVLMRKEL